MKKTIKKLTTLLIVVILFFGFVGCIKENNIYEDGYFQCIIVGENSRFPN